MDVGEHFHLIGDRQVRQFGQPGVDVGELLSGAGWCLGARLWLRARLWLGARLRLWRDDRGPKATRACIHQSSSAHDAELTVPLMQISRLPNLIALPSILISR